MSVSRCGPLAAWSNAFVAGQVSLDQVVDAVVASRAQRQVHGLPDADALGDVVVAWRRAGSPVRVVLPVPGDVRGVSGPDGFRRAALDAGEAAHAAALGVVPQVVERGPSSAPPGVQWQAFALEPAPADHQSVEDAQYELGTAIRESASALAAADVAGSGVDVPDALQGARRAGERLNLPPGHPQGAVRLLAQAERMQAVLDLARTDPVSGALERGVAVRHSVLRELATAVRRARVAGYNAVAY